MPFGDVVQQFQESDKDEVALTWGVDADQPSEGNLLILVAGNRDSDNFAPAGWTELYKVQPWAGSSSTRCYIWAKIAEPPEAGVSFLSGNGRPVYWGMEVEGPFKSLPTEIKEYTGHAEDTVDKDTGLPPGSSGVLAQAVNLAIAVTFYRGGAGNASPIGSSVDGGFAAGNFAGFGGTDGFTLGLVPAYKVTAVTDALNPRITWSTGAESTFLSVTMMVVLGAEIAGEPHNNMPPYLAAKWAIYAGR